MPQHACLCGGGAENSDRDDTQDFGLEFLKCFMIIRILAVVLSRSVSIFQCTLCCFEGLCTCAGLWSLGGPPSLVPGPAVELS